MLPKTVSRTRDFLWQSTRRYAPDQLLPAETAGSSHARKSVLGGLCLGGGVSSLFGGGGGGGVGWGWVWGGFGWMPHINTAVSVDTVTGE